MSLADNAPDLAPELLAALTQIARVPKLLIACDYDGTLSPIVSDPTAALPLPEGVAGVRALASLPDTSVAVISGRALRDLALLSRLPNEIHLVGSHGSEFDLGFVNALPVEAVKLHAELHGALAELTRGHSGVRLEVKPASIAVHVRSADRAIAAKVLEAVRTGPATWKGVHATEGKEVIELAVIPTNKGNALVRLRSQLGVSAVLYVGDDVTDENAFAELHGPDLGIKVGQGESRAAFRVADPSSVALLLATLVGIRRNWLLGERSAPIERHTMLSNGRNVALITPDARVTWMCHPRSDSAAVFADLLGGESAGHCTVTPLRTERHLLGQRYRESSLTVETRWSGLTVTDWLDTEGAEDDLTVLVRLLTGSEKAQITFAPRPEYGQVSIQLRPMGGDGLHVLGSNEPIALYAPGLEWDITDDGGRATARAVVDLAAVGGSYTIEVRCGTHELNPPVVSAEDRRDAIDREYREWVNRLVLPTVARNHVRRSALTLKALCDVPTGAILAAATTSLPETIGGVRNWDYRYCWLRDGAMTARSLVDLGSLDEAEAFLRWVTQCVERTGGHPERLHPLYTLEGNELGAEAVLENLPGYAGSRPVRVGNAANRQVQLDVFGPITDLVAAVAGRRGHITDAEWSIVESMVAAVERRWHEPDHGVWEVRMPPRQHVYSKVMCWQTVDHALDIAQRHDRPVGAGWHDLRAQISENVLSNGWHDDVKAYTVAYGSSDLDASSLWIGLSGLLPADNPRFLSTVLAIEAELRSGPTVYRYTFDDGLPGVEGGFLICAAWLAEAYLLTGRRHDAEELFQQILDCAGPTGLLPEQYDPVNEQALGNHPQAYSHLGLIRCALLLDKRT